MLSKNAFYFWRLGSEKAPSCIIELKGTSVDVRVVSKQARWLACRSCCTSEFQPQHLTTNMIIGSDLVRLRRFVFLEQFLICREDRIRKGRIKGDLSIQCCQTQWNMFRRPFVFLKKYKSGGGLGRIKVLYGILDIVWFSGSQGNIKFIHWKSLCDGQQNGPGCHLQGLL